VESLVHSDSTVVTKYLRNSERNFCKLATNQALINRRLLGHLGGILTAVKTDASRVQRLRLPASRKRGTLLLPSPCLRPLRSHFERCRVSLSPNYVKGSYSLKRKPSLIQRKSDGANLEFLLFVRTMPLK
jgi:hypothetical protein